MTNFHDLDPIETQITARHVSVFYGDKRADQGRSIIANPYIYSLSLAVYATAWTFYGSVGRAAEDGIGFLPIYLGPTLVAVQTLALDSGDLGRALALGVAYWLGLALPFVLVAVLLGRIVPALDWAKRHIRAINITGGVVLILIGVLMVAGLWRPFLSWVGVIVSGFTPAL